MIISCVDQPFEEDGPTVTVIFRDCTGKYCWQFRSAFLSFAERNASSRTLEHCAVPVKTCSTPFQANVLPLGEDKFSNLTEALARKKWPFDPLALAGEMVSKEEEYLSQVHYNLNHAIAVDIPQSADPYISSCKFQQVNDAMLFLLTLYPRFENVNVTHILTFKKLGSPTSNPPWVTVFGELGSHSSSRANGWSIRTTAAAR